MKNAIAIFCLLTLAGGAVVAQDGSTTWSAVELQAFAAEMDRRAGLIILQEHEIARLEHKNEVLKAKSGCA